MHVTNPALLSTRLLPIALVVARVFDTAPAPVMIPIDVELGAQVPDKDVIPDDLESSDDED